MAILRLHVTLNPSGQIIVAVCKIWNWYHPSSLLSVPVGLAESHISGCLSAWERMPVNEHAVVPFWLCVRVFVCVLILLSGKVSGCHFLAHSKPGELDRLYCLFCVSQTTTGGETEGSEGHRVCLCVCEKERERGVCVHCCPENVLLLIQRLNIEQNTHAFRMRCCVFVLSFLATQELMGWSVGRPL